MHDGNRCCPGRFRRTLGALLLVVAAGGCATVLRETPRNAVVNTGLVVKTERFHLEQGNVRAEVADAAERFVLEGRIIRSWQEGQREDTWLEVEVSRPTGAWEEVSKRREHAYGSETHTVRTWVGSQVVTREERKRKSRQLPNLHKTQRVEKALDLVLEDERGKILGEGRVKPGEALSFDILRAAYPFRKDFAVTARVRDGTVDTSRLKPVRFVYPAESLVGRYVEHGSADAGVPPELSWKGELRISTEDSQKKQVQAGDRVWLQAVVANGRRGGDAFGLKVLVEAGEDMPFVRVPVAAVVRAGDSLAVRIPYDLPYSKEGATYRLRMRAQDGFGRVGEALDAPLQVLPTGDLPELQVLRAAEARDRAGHAGIELTVRNRGKRAAIGVKVSLRLDLSEEGIDLGTLDVAKVEAHSQRKLWYPLPEGFVWPEKLQLTTQVLERQALEGVQGKFVLLRDPGF